MHILWTPPSVMSALMHLLSCRAGIGLPRAYRLATQSRAVELACRSKLQLAATHMPQHALQVAPNVAAMILLTALPLVAALMATTTAFGVLCLRTLSSPVRGNGHVYGLAVSSCAAVSASAWRQRQLEVMSRPDVKDEIPNNDWITDDIQARPVMTP